MTDEQLIDMISRKALSVARSYYDEAFKLTCQPSDCKVEAKVSGRQDQCLCHCRYRLCCRMLIGRS